MMLLALLDPEGTKQRRTKRLKRRIYRSKVIKCISYFDYRDQTLLGTVMDMIN